MKQILLQLGVTYGIEAFLHHVDDRIETRRIRGSLATLAAGAVMFAWIAWRNDPYRNLGVDLWVVVMVTMVVIIYKRVVSNSLMPFN